MDKYAKLNVPRRAKIISIHKSLKEIQDAYCCMVKGGDCPDTSLNSDVDACQECLFSEDNVLKFEEWYEKEKLAGRGQG